MSLFCIRLSCVKDTILGYLIDDFSGGWFLRGIAPLKIEDIVCQEVPLLSHVLGIVELLEDPTPIILVLLLNITFSP